MFLADIFSTLTVQTITKVLDATALNQVLISNNIANVNTPGYKRSEVTFRDQLKRALSQSDVSLSRTHTSHLPIAINVSQVEPKIEIDSETVMRWDGNNVDVEREMAKLSHNSMEYNMFSTLLKRNFDGLRRVIEGR